MWKKIGTVRNGLNDEDRSHKSKNENLYETFQQMTKLRLSKSQQRIQRSDNFRISFLSRNKSNESKSVKSSIKLDKLQRKSTLKRIKFLQEENVKDSALEEFSNSIIEKKSQVNVSTHNIVTDATTQMIQNSQTSLGSERKFSLKKYKSTPQLLLFGAIKEQLLPNTKKQAQQNVKQLKKQHLKLKSSIQNEIKTFNSQFNQIKTNLTNTLQKQSSSNSTQNIDQKLTNSTNQFCEHVKSINQKKNELMLRYKAIR